VTYSEGERKDLKREMEVDFMELVPVIERMLVGLGKKNESTGFRLRGNDIKGKN